MVGTADRLQQFDLAAEMRVDEWLGDTELAGDIIEGRAAETAFVEQLDRFFQDALTLVGGYLFAHGV